MARRNRPPHLKPAPDRPRPPSAEDLALFRQAVADAQPLGPDARVRLENQLPKPLPRRLEFEADTLGTLSEGGAPIAPTAPREAGEPLAFSRPGLQRQVLRQLRRGGRSVEVELDLHGLTVPQARGLLASFLVASRERGTRCVRIIHGKGLRSEGGEGVLKAAVEGWLREWEDVLAFHQARPEHGGGGAVVVLLRGPR